MSHLLLAVCGMTPQIITETLYGIYRQDPTRLPERIEVITTWEGRGRLEKNLLGPDSPLARLCRDYGLPAIGFTTGDIRVPLDDDGQPLGDVRSPREQEIITDFITQRVRELTADPGLAIHASLAGGRKTMGFALGYAMSLFGRPQDCLSHVLVSAPFESVPDFYYPTPEPVWRADIGKAAQHDLSTAQVTLAAIPLVLMRQEMPHDLISNHQLSYTRTVERINRANALTRETARVELDFTHLSVWCDGQEVCLKPDCFAFYSWLAQDSKANPGEGIGAPSDEMQVRELDDRLAAFFRAVRHPSVGSAGQQDLPALYEAAGDAVDAMVVQDQQRQAQDPHHVPRGRWLLQDNNSNRSLYVAQERPELALLIKRHKELWARLLKETNQALTEALGERLASHYRLVTVSSMPGRHSRTRYDFKGLDLLPQHILLR